MISTRSALAFSSVAVVLLLTGCPKKEGGAEAGATADTAATATTAATETPEPDAGTTATTKTGKTGGGGGGGTAAKPTDGGAGDGGATADDGGTAGDGGAAQECCCEVTGQTPVSVGQSECVKTRKGQCVKKERCAGGAADAGAGAAATDAGAAQQCCCDAAGKKELVGQSACVKERKGQCVKMTECKR